MTVLSDWNLPLNVDDILQGQGMDPEVVRKNKPLLAAVAERARTEGLRLLHPVALTREIAIHGHGHAQIRLEGGAKLAGPLVTRHLAGATRVAVTLCSIGPDLEEVTSRMLDEDPAYALALDGLGNAAVESLAQQICGGIAEQARAGGLTASTPLSPGSPEWPADVGQPEIFALVDAEQAGIRITPGGMMIPKKSMSFVVGIGRNMAQTDLCDVCSLKETCRYRHA